MVIAAVVGHLVRAGGCRGVTTAVAVTAVGDALHREVGPRGVRGGLVEPGVVAAEESASGRAPLTTDGGSPPTPLYAAGMAATILCVLPQPAHVSVNEILSRLTKQQVSQTGLHPRYGGTRPVVVVLVSCGVERCEPRAAGVPSARGHPVTWVRSVASSASTTRPAPSASAGRTRPMH